VHNAYGALTMLAIISAAILLSLISCGGVPAEFFVAPGGSDEYPGTISAPFATLAHARDIARDHRPATIYLRTGRYQLDDTLQLDERDSGIKWSAYRGEHAVISGGTPISGWTGPDAYGRWTAHTDVDNFRQLYVNGTRATRSRMALLNPTMVVAMDTIRDGGAGFVVHPDITNWKNITDMELGLFGPFNAWSESICEIQSTIRADGGTFVILDNPCFYLARHKAGVMVSTAGYLENALEILAPGQFYLDRPDHRIYYIPRPGEDMVGAEVVAPQLQTLMTITGSVDRPVKGISFTGINFEHTSWLGTSSPQGFPEVQAAFRLNPTKVKIGADGALYPIKDEADKTPGGVVLSHVDGAVFVRCSFAHMGGSGIDIQSGSHDNLILGSTVFDISANGIQIGDVQGSDLSIGDARMIVDGNTVSNSYIHHVGAEYSGAVGIFVGYTSRTTLIHNELTQLPYSGISVGWGWGRENPTPARANVVRYNHVHEIMQQRSDGGGIYTLGSMPRTKISSNLIHDNAGPPGGIYLDLGSAGIEVSGNIIFKVSPDLPYTSAIFPIFLNNQVSEEGLCSVHDNVVNDPEATLPEAGLEPAYRDLLLVQ
jgi:Right handed beta helix region